MNHIISHKKLTIDYVKTLLSGGVRLELGKEAEEAIVKCRKFLDTKMEDIGRPVYGVTTGFGSLCNITIPAEDLSQLQHNLVMSHACGIGETEALDEAAAAHLITPMMVLLNGKLAAEDLSFAEEVEAVFGEDHADACKKLIRSCEAHRTQNIEGV